MTPPEERDELARELERLLDKRADRSIPGARVHDQLTHFIERNRGYLLAFLRTPDSVREAVLEEADVEGLAELACLAGYSDEVRANLERRRNPTYWESISEDARQSNRAKVRAIVRALSTPSPITPDPDEPCPKCDDSGYIEYSGGGIWTGENVTIRQELCDCPCGQDAARQFAKPATPDPEIVRAVEAEREACAALAEEMGDNSPQFIAEAIRSRPPSDPIHAEGEG